MEEWYRKLDVIRAVNVGAISAAALYGRTDSGIATFKEILKAVENLQSADPEAAIVKVLKMVEEYKEKTGTDEIIIMPKNGMKAWDENGVEYTMQPTCNNLATDCVYRQEAIDAIKKSRFLVDAMEKVIKLPSAQPERTCVNCGRTVNNGGWYADGGTRCPIEEHYALPKDGYCHLWEKRNVTDDDCPERREE